jgi:hypothetical protein
MKYPGRTIKVGEKDASIVRALKKQLNSALAAGRDAELRLDPEDASFGPRMKQAVKLFQTRNVDSEGRPLKQDGEVGLLTWEALFGAKAVPASETPKNAYFKGVLALAGREADRGVLEVPKNSNRGPEVSEYLKRAGVPPGLSWCCAFVYWCFDEVALAGGRSNPMVKTAGCLDHWRRATDKGAKLITKKEALENPGLVQPGMIFIIDHGRGLGHTGLVEKVEGGLLSTIEGNTDASRTREGGGVYRLTRKILEINKGFIDYSAGL